MEYAYPIRTDWSTDEMIQVTHFFTMIESAYESGAVSIAVKEAYKEFKKIVPSKAEEKTLFKEFEQVSGYNSYQVVKKAQANEDNVTIHMT